MLVSVRVPPGPGTEQALRLQGKSYACVHNAIEPQFGSVKADRQLHYDCPAGHVSPCSAVLPAAQVAATYQAMLANPATFGFYLPGAVQPGAVRASQTLLGRQLLCLPACLPACLPSDCCAGCMFWTDHAAVCFEDPLGVLAKLAAGMADAAANATAAACNSSAAAGAASVDPADYTTCARIAALNGGSPCGMTAQALVTASGLAGAADGLTAAELASTVAASCRELCGLCPAPLPATMTRSILYLGWPLKGYTGA
eukprot:SAG22_NODE_2113_length_2993_cov_25.505874_2_plen_256_part_00